MRKMRIESHINCDVNENAVWRPMGTEKKPVWEVFLKNQSEWISNNIRNITDRNYLDTQIKTVFSHSTKKHGRWREYDWCSVSPNEHTICLIIGSPSREDCFRFDFDFIFSRGQSIATHAISSEWWKNPTKNDQGPLSKHVKKPLVGKAWNVDLWR